MKEITKEEVWIDWNGVKHYSPVKVLVSDNEYYTRKYYESGHHSSFDKIFEAFEDYVDSKDWD